MNHEGKRIRDPKKILQELRGAFLWRNIYTSKNIDPQLPEFSYFFEKIENILSEKEAETCEGEITLDECYNAIKSMATNKSPGSDDFTAEFYHHFWNLIANYMVESFNYAFQNRVFFPSRNDKGWFL